MAAIHRPQSAGRVFDRPHHVVQLIVKRAGPWLESPGESYSATMSSWRMSPPELRVGDRADAGLARTRNSLVGGMIFGKGRDLDPASWRGLRIARRSRQRCSEENRHSELPFLQMPQHSNKRILTKGIVCIADGKTAHSHLQRAEIEHPQTKQQKRRRRR